jgi:hypothetical protein
VVRVLHCSKEDGLTNACTKSVKTKVYTEHFVHRLSELKKPFQPEEGAHVLGEALKGFAEIWKVHGVTFPVADSHIGFTDSDEIKVWLHEDLGELSPAEDLSRASNGEHRMAETIIQAVQQHVAPGFPPDVLALLHSQAPLKLEPLAQSLDKLNRERLYPDQGEYRPPLQHLQRPAVRESSLKPLQQSFTPVDYKPEMVQRQPYHYEPVRQYASEVRTQALPGQDQAPFQSYLRPIRSPIVESKALHDLPEQQLQF